MSNKNKDIRLRSWKTSKKAEESKDVFFVLDDSGSVNDANFSVMVAAVCEAIRGVNQPDSQFAIICFHNTTTTVCGITMDKEEAIKKIQKYERKKGSTATHLALKEVKQMYIRKGAKRQLFLCTDGAPDSQEATMTAADELKKMNVEIYGIGIGLNSSTEQKFREICSLNKMFPVDQFNKLEQTLQSELGKKTIQDYSLLVKVQVEKKAYPISLGDDLKLAVYFGNNGKKTIPAGLNMLFVENDYFEATPVFVKEDIINGRGDIRVDVVLRSKGVDDPRLIPEYMEVTFEHEKPNIALYCEYNTFELRSDIFIKDIVGANSPLKEINFFNVLCFGVVGSGKSSFINSILTALSNRIISPAAVGGSSDHVTRQITKFNVSQVPGLDSCIINLIDIWGLQDGGFLFNMLLTVLKGELPPDYVMSDRVSFNEKLNPAMWSAYERRIHTVLIFMPYNVLDDPQMKSALSDNFRVCTAHFQTNPIVIVTRASQAGDEEDQKNCKKKLSREFNIPEASIYMFDNYTAQESKTMAIDKKTLAILKHIINNCETGMRANKAKILEQYEESRQNPPKSKPASVPASAPKPNERCPNCSNVVQPTWKKCPDCETPLTKEVPKPVFNDKCACGETLKPTWKKCPGCERPVAQPKPVFNDKCACGETLKQSWKKCPGCERPVAQPEPVFNEKCQCGFNGLKQSWKKCPECERPVKGGKKA